MDIAWFRDLVIVIFGAVATAAIVFVAVLLFLLYRRVKPILDSVKAIASTAQTVSSYTADEVAKPLIQIAGIVQGIVQGIRAASSMFSKREGEEDER